MKIAKASSLVLLSMIAVSSVCVAATSPVGRPIKFYETSVIRLVLFQLAGTTCTPNSYTTCIALNEYGTGNFTDLEVASVAVSGSFGRSTLCANPNGQTIYDFAGRVASGEEPSSFQYDYRYELQSAVLNDLSLINPKTGMAFNGKISFPVISTFRDQDFVSYMQRILRVQKFGSYDCGTPVVNYSTLVNTYGLSSFDAQRVLGGAVTIRLFITGGFVATDGGTFSMQLRMIGD
jgi:hypothetical protein